MATVEGARAVEQFGSITVEHAFQACKWGRPQYLGFSYEDGFTKLVARSGSHGIGQSDVNLPSSA